jgi:ketosteroid isomerase-like protein
MRRLFATTMVLSLTAITLHAQAAALAADAGIERFNQALIAATRRMDNAATLALWEVDGVSLIPGAKPIVGKPAIAKYLDDVTAPLKGAKMETFEMNCSGLVVSGDWASEWCTEHQVVNLPGGRPKFDGWGTTLFVLRRDADGRWRLAREAWTQGVATPAR